MPDNPRNGCPARHLCESTHINMGCGSDICPRPMTTCIGCRHPAHAERCDFPIVEDKGFLRGSEIAGTCSCGELVELTGDDLPYHLRLDAPPLGRCNRCQRQTWSTSEVGTEDRMTQPDGNPCGGRIVSEGKMP